MEYEIVHDDAMEVLTRMTDNSVDAIVTDPPYGLSFMGKKWDYDVPPVMVWKECLRVLKPGGHLLSFGGSRTYHRMVCAIEDAGFEIRDQIMWLYGSGFPKSHNLSDDWEGWGTQLKPAHEPIVMARKPFKGTVANNVLEHGTGALNIDASRIDYNGEKPNIGGRGAHGRGDGYGFKALGDDLEANSTGRWPANIIHDGIDSEWARYFYCPKPSKAERGEHNDHPTVKPVALMEYLVRLVSPPGGVVLDPFLGSGTTGVAAIKQGFHFIGIEREDKYIPIAEARMAHINDEIVVVEETEWV